MSNHEPIITGIDPLPILQSPVPYSGGFGRPLTSHERKKLRQLIGAMSNFATFSAEDKNSGRHHTSDDPKPLYEKIPVTNGSIVVRGMAYALRGKPKQYYYQAICRVTRAPGAMINPRHKRIPR